MDTIIQKQVGHDTVVSIAVRLVGQARRFDSGISSYQCLFLPMMVLIIRPLSRLEKGEKKVGAKSPSVFSIETMWILQNTR